MARAIAVAAVLLVGLLAVACDDEATDGTEPATATVDVSESSEVEEPSPTEALSAPTEPPAPTTTTIPPTPRPPTATQLPPVTNRRSCGAIRGTSYLSEDERQWFQANCIVPTPVPQAPIQPPAQSCHPSYVGACLLIGAGDYDCRGGSGNGPNYTGRVRVVGPDEFGLDRDNDGIGCE